MAYFALPTRDSTSLLLVNAAPVLPHGSRTTSRPSRPQLDAALSKLPARLHSLSLATDYRRLSASIFSNRGPRGRVYSSVEGSVTVEEPATDVETTPAPVEETAPETVAVEAETSESTIAPPKQLERRNSMQQRRLSKVITVQKEQLLPGAVFTGVVRAVQNYGAFVDIGAFTDGLIHISELSSSYVRSVEDVVSVGQELTVRVIEMDDKAGRIALTMRDKENEVAETEAQGGGQNEISFTREGGDGKVQNRAKIAGRGGSSSRGRSNDDKKTTKLTKGQELAGKVKNIIRNGAFIELPEGEEGFLRGGEITEGGENVAVETLLQIGQEVTVRVLRIERGKVNLTMKAQVDMKSINKSINKNEEGGASNPFEVFFRNANLISSSESSEESSAAVDEQPPVEAPNLVTPSNHSEEVSPASDEPAAESAAMVETPAIEEDKSESSTAVDEQPAVEASVQAAETEAPTLVTPSDLTEEVSPESDEPAAMVETPAIEEEKSEILAAVDEQPAAEASVQAAETEAPTLVTPSNHSEEVSPASDEPAAETAAMVETPAIEEEKSESSATVDTDLTAISDEQVAEELAEAMKDITDLAESAAEDLSTENKFEAAVDKRIEESPAPITDVMEVTEVAAPVPDASAAIVEAESVGEETKSSTPEPVTEGVSFMEPPSISTEQTSESTLTLDSVADTAGAEIPAAEATLEISDPTLTLDSVAPEASHVEAPTTTPEAVAEAPQVDQAKAAPSSGPTAAQVKQLRDITGAGMMECKRAMVACNSDVAKATEYLRKKGLASADKKASRVAAEGRVGSYVHDGRIGVLVEVNCETDFVSRGDIFKELVADMGMQVVACPGVEYVSTDDVSPDYVQKEKEIEMGKEDLANKPPQIREKIVEGRIAKRLAELALLEQAYIRDDKILVKDLVKQTIASIGEKVQVRRFVRYNLGEGIAKKSVDFAAEVAAQTAAKADVKPVAETPKVEEVKEEDTAPKVAVPAATVKKLRDATGAGMMDCKKALVACDNDVEKATEYLRKKGLASADKKSSRIASEGLIGSYIHDGRIGVLIEVNSETDFVARSAQFKELVADMGMQVAACPQVQYVSVDEIPAEIVEKEKEIESGKEDLAKKPEGVRSKIVEGRVAKTLNELVLLEQPYIRDDKLSVKEYIKQTIASLGENIQVRRFTRFNLGEGIEKRSTDFAAEVAAQTAAKA